MSAMRTMTKTEETFSIRAHSAHENFKCEGVQLSLKDIEKEEIEK